MSIYLFLLSPPRSGSTVLWKLLATSPNVSALPKEGQFLDSVRPVMREQHWNPERQFPWQKIKSEWENIWDSNKLIKLEKSPPNLLRAKEIEKVFNPSYFIVTIRSPYAFCEGYVRRRGKPVESAAEFWLKCAQSQIYNIKNLKNVEFFTYENFTENPLEVRTRILDFLPQLNDIDLEGNFSARSILGREARKISNLNQIKIDQLSSKNILKINNVLERHPECMSFFGYDFIYPSKRHTVRHYQSIVRLKANQLSQRTKRLSKRLASKK